MLGARLASGNDGLTLIELAIGMAIVAITLMVGVPTLADWINNLQIRNAAEGIQSGLQIARGEAVRRNTHVEFALSNPGTTGGTGWSVVSVNSGDVIQSKPDGEGSKKAILTVTPSGATTITFNGMGRTPTTPATNADGTAFITRIDVDSAALSSAESRELRILVGSGGQIRMCDPNVSDSTDPRSC